jgi:lipoprotein signal peptidase
MMTLFFLTIDVNPLTMSSLISVLITSSLLGGVLSLVYVTTHKRTVYDQSFNLTLLMLPLVISVIVLLISDNLARAFSLAGVFTLVRFRTAIADSRDITYIMSTVGIALASAMGLVGIAIIITAFLSMVILVLHFFKMDRESTAHAKLRIIIPESLNYSNAFDDVFKKYVMSYQLQKVKTTDFGTMFELTYLIKTRPSINQKAFLDELRVRNGNLSITLTSDYVSMVSEL